MKRSTLAFALVGSLDTAAFAAPLAPEKLVGNEKCYGEGRQ